MAGDDFVVVVDQHRDVEAEGADAFGNLRDLLLAVLPRIEGVEP